MRHAPAVAFGGILSKDAPELLLPRGERFHLGQSLYREKERIFLEPCGIVVETFSGPVLQYGRERLERFGLRSRGDVLQWLEDASGEFEVTLDHWITYVRWAP